LRSRVRAPRSRRISLPPRSGTPGGRAGPAGPETPGRPAAGGRPAPPQGRHSPSPDRGPRRGRELPASSDRPQGDGGRRVGRDAFRVDGDADSPGNRSAREGGESMTRHYFGTDGIRGPVGTVPMTVDFALRLASSAAHVLAPRGGTVLIGKDTRVSGYMFESALEAGFVASGVDVLLTGPLPTPAIAYLTRKLGADFGIVINASHKPFNDNGIKFFD